jgi:predicted dienelactone hydrolase
MIMTRLFLLLFLHTTTSLFVSPILAAPSLSETTVAKRSVGTRQIEFQISGTTRLVVAEIYYPIDGYKAARVINHGIWNRRSYTKDAPLAHQEQLYPLVIFSHGWQGDRFHHTWLAEALVDAGYIMAMIDHAHNNSYEHSDEFVYTSLWQRPRDLTALLDHLLKDPLWSKSIDKDRIAAGGFSLGGLTALWIAGIEGDAEAFKDAMKHEARWSDWPQSVKTKANQVDWTQAQKSYRDPRVKAVFSIAPAMGEGFKPQGIKQARIPVLLITGGHDIITPAALNANYFHTHIKDSEILKISCAEHYTFLNTCSPLGTRRFPHMCEDRSSINRHKVHRETARRIVVFLNSNLSH